MAIVGSTLLSGANALAANEAGIETGTYLPVPSLAKGETQMCDREPIKVSISKHATDSKLKVVHLSGQHSYSAALEDHISRIPSEFNSACMFVEKNVRRINGSTLIVTTTNSEVCGTTANYSDVTTLTFTPDRITLEVSDELGKVPGYTCVYTLKK